MKRMIVVAVLALSVLAGGCVTVVSPTGQRIRYVMPQVGVIVRVHNNCTPFIDLESVEGVMVAGLAYGEAATVPLASMPFSGSSRQLWLTAKGYRELNGKREYLGSTTRQFNVNVYSGSQTEVWEVTQLQLPGSRGGCQ